MNVQNDNFQENVEIIQTELVTGEHEVKTAEKIGVEEFSINGDALGAKIKELVHQGIFGGLFSKMKRVIY